MTPTSGHTGRIRGGMLEAARPAGEKWGAPSNTNNTIPIVNIPIVNISTVNIPIVRTQKNNMQETRQTDKKTHTLGTPFAQARWRI